MYQTSQSENDGELIISAKGGNKVCSCQGVLLERIGAVSSERVSFNSMIDPTNMD